MEIKAPIKDLENWNIRENGEKVCFHTNGLPVFDSQGNFKGYRGVNKDITEWKQSEKALLDSETRLRAIFEQAGVSIALVNTKTGQFIRVNQRYCDFVGYSMDEFLSKTFMDITHPDDVQANVDINELLMHGKGRIFSSEKRYIHKNGSTVWGNLTISPLWKMGETPQEFFHIAIVEDISVRKSAEELLRASEARFKTIFNESPIGIALIDSLSGKICSVNPMFCKIAGRPENEMLQLDGMSITHPEDAQKDLENMALLNAGKIKGFQMDKRYLRPDGSYCWIFMTVAPLLIEDEDKPRHLCMISDITERKGMEVQLLERERLSAVGELSAGVAHDFNNSMQIILGNIELAFLAEGVSDDLVEHLETIRSATIGAAARVKHLQNFAQKETVAGKASGVDLGALLDETILQTQPKWKDEAQKRGIVINIEKHYHAVNFIDCNIGEIRSAFYNIIKNALEAMPQGGTLVFETCDSEKGVWARIKDTGSGMTEETRKKVFQPFFTTKGFEQGKGLGMTGVYSTIRNHGGEINVESTPGKGTTVALLFPVGTNSRKNLPTEDSNGHDRHARVLWVDDEAQIRRLANKFLEKLGHEIDVAESGTEALTILERKQFDLLITDVGMPGMSGWELAKQVKNKFPCLKIVIASGWAGDVTDSQKKESGVSYLLQKPVSLNSIKDVIREVMQSRIPSDN